MHPSHSPYYRDDETPTLLSFPFDTTLSATKLLYLGWNRGAFNCARDLVGIDHIVYGTDYFIVGTKFMDWTNEFLEGLDLSPVEREKVYGQNAARILNL